MATTEAHANVRDKDTIRVSLSALSITPTPSPNALVKSAQHSYAPGFDPEMNPHHTPTTKTLV